MLPTRYHLKTSDVASLLGVSLQTVYNWLRSGKIVEPERNPLTSYRLWSVKDVELIRTAILEGRRR
jgi:DNA-binding transcriptional MerR regulator